MNSIVISRLKNRLLLAGRLPELPRYARFKPDLEATYYGASRLVARRLGIPHVPPAACQGWMHGCHFVLPASTKFFLRYPDAGGNVLVARRDEKAFLESKGLRNVYAVGLPVTYTEPSRARRIPGSLLVMPPHVSSYGADRFSEGEYIDFIRSVSGDFESVVCCISSQCKKKGLWIKGFVKAGIPVLAGAGIDDANALARMRTIFDAFEYVTTNALGSHVAYAAAFGCRTSVAGPLAIRSRESLREEPFYKENPDLMEAYSPGEKLKQIRERHPWMFVEPHRAGKHAAEAGELLGMGNRIGLPELAGLLGLAPG